MLNFLSIIENNYFIYDGLILLGSLLRGVTLFKNQGLLKTVELRVKKNPLEDMEFFMVS